MSKRQRRRVAKRRNMHVEHVKRRTVLSPRLPIALAAVAVPAVAAPAAQATPGAHHLNAAALGGTGSLAHHSSLAGIGTIHERSTLGTRRSHRAMTGSFAGLSRSGATEAASGRIQRWRWRRRRGLTWTSSACQWSRGHRGSDPRIQLIRCGFS
jgi:hypothetical protein